MIENLILPFLIGMAVGANSVRFIDSWREKRNRNAKVQWDPPYPPPPFKERPKRGKE